VIATSIHLINVFGSIYVLFWLTNFWEFVLFLTSVHAQVNVEYYLCLKIIRVKIFPVVGHEMKRIVDYCATGNIITCFCHVWVFMIFLMIDDMRICFILKFSR